MFKNYIKLAFRNLLKQKFYSVINILGLSIGIACSLLVFLYVSDEMSYDKFHSNADRIFRIALNGKIAGSEFNAPVSVAPLAHELVIAFPEVIDAVRLYKLSNEVTRYEDKVFNEKKAFFADSNFFQFFNFKLLEGDPSQVLKEPHSIVLSEALAEKYFGQEPAIGKILVIGNFNSAYTVTGIMENWSFRSHFHADMLMSMASYKDAWQEVWVSNKFFTYILLDKNSSWKNLEKKIPDWSKKFIEPQVETYLNISKKDFYESGNKLEYYLQPIKDIHLQSNLEAEIEPNGNLEYLYILSAIGFFILLLACINFMNLATAKSSGRAKEVGVRKVVGSLKSNMKVQFLIESFIYCIIAFVFSFLFVEGFIQEFNRLAGKSLNMLMLLQHSMIGFSLLLLFIVGLLSGSYPAFYLSSFNAVEVLKGRKRKGRKSSRFRSILVVFQFSISIILIICTIVVFQQLEFMQNKNLGYEKENTLVITNIERLAEHFDAFKNSLMEYPQFRSFSSANSFPSDPGFSNSIFKTIDDNQDHLLSFIKADDKFLETLNIDLLYGRSFLSENVADTNSIILNETAVRTLGIKDPLGKELIFSGNNNRFCKIIGVMKDFHYESFFKPIKPLALLYSPQAYLLAIRMDPGDISKNIQLLNSKWKEFAPGEPMEYSFLNKNYEALYVAEKKLGRVFSLFTGLALFIACLGLLGLAAYTAEQKTKEIGIRKVMGATTIEIVLMLSKEFTKLILISFFISIPIAYYTISYWLQNFAYKISINFSSFIIAGLLTILVALFTVGFQAIKAALANPVRSLRAE
jgi:putative ABC transport system permease protein